MDQRALTVHAEWPIRVSFRGEPIKFFGRACEQGSCFRMLGLFDGLLVDSSDPEHSVGSSLRRRASGEGLRSGLPGLSDESPAGQRDPNLP